MMRCSGGRPEMPYCRCAIQRRKSACLPRGRLLTCAFTSASLRWQPSPSVVCEQSNCCGSALQRRACYDSNLNMAQTSIRQNLLQIQERIANAANRAGRRIEDITLIGVSKTHPAITIQEAFQAGVRHFGENRVQEWEVKRVGTNNLAATWHLIGHLQGNKAPKAAKLFHTVDSVDDFALAQKLDRARAEANMSSKLRVLFEVRVEREETKSGVEMEALPELAEKVA